MDYTIPQFGSLDREDYRAIGFKSGLEIHQQLLTFKKLFCHCPTGLYSDQYDASVLRHMRPTLSELGEYDGTALMEFKKHKDVVYLLNQDSVCTYEMDDTPPFWINEYALDIAIEIALLLNCSIVGELHIMRKQYLDGSIPTGFQRTAIVGLNGWIPYENAPNGRVRIRQLAIEEDSCREVSDLGHTIIFRTDRLSMPLIEIVTEPDMLTPTDCAEVAWRLAMTTRSTGKVRRGLGSVRQDVNCSIEGSTRIEIKGVPKIGLIPKLTHYEAFRQKALLDLQSALLEQNISLGEDDCKKFDLIKIVQNISPKWHELLLSQNEVVSAIRINGFKPFAEQPTQPNLSFMDEISGIVDVVACINKKPNIIYKPNQIEIVDDGVWSELCRFTGAGVDDLLIVVTGNSRDVGTALAEIESRVRMAKDTGVPNETRSARLGNGTTLFERVLPGPDRMYPDTDLPPLSITQTRIDAIQKTMPDFIWNRFKKYRDSGLSSELISELLKSGFADLFDSIKANCPSISDTFIAKTLCQTIKYLRRSGVDVDSLNDTVLQKVFTGITEGLYSKDALPKILREVAKNPESSMLAIAERLNIRVLQKEELGTIIHSAIAENLYKIKDPNCAGKFMMGRIMQDYRGGLDGAIAFSVLAKELANTPSPAKEVR